MTHGMTWFRFYHEALSDRKIQKICAITGRPKFLVIGFWTSILCMASESPERGRLLLVDDLPLTQADIFNEMGIDIETGETFLETFVKLKLISIDDDGAYCISQWANRQYESDNSTDRVRKHRAKKASETAQTHHNNGSLGSEGKGDDYTQRSGNVSGNVSETDQIRNRSETDTEGDTDQIAPAGAEKPTHTGESKKLETMCNAVAALCVLELEAIPDSTRQKVAGTAAYLLKRGVEPPQVARFGKWWRFDDPPYPSQVQAEWLKFEEAIGNGRTNGKSDHIYTPGGAGSGTRAVESAEEMQRKLEALRRMNELTKQMAVQ